MTRFNNIVVAVDFGPGSREAVERALSMAHAATRVTIVHALADVPLVSPRYMYGLMQPDLQRRVAREAWRRIAAIIPANAARSSRVHARVVTGDPVAAISRVAAEVDADLILVGVTARGVIGRLFLRSMAARVIAASGRPVLAVPEPAGEAASVHDEDQLAAAA